jgi:hypothetical protein
MTDPVLQSVPPNLAPVSRPQVVVWYKAYLGFLLFLFLIVVAVGAMFFTDMFDAEDLDGMPPELMGGIYVVMGIVMIIPTVAAFFLPRKRWAWIFHIVMICIGMTGCTVFFSIPLLIFWIKPETKAWFDNPG